MEKVPQVEPPGVTQHCCSHLLARAASGCERTLARIVGCTGGSFSSFETVEYLGPRLTSAFLIRRNVSMPGRSIMSTVYGIKVESKENEVGMLNNLPRVSNRKILVYCFGRELYEQGHHCHSPWAEICECHSYTCAYFSIVQYPTFKSLIILLLIT